MGKIAATLGGFAISLYHFTHGRVRFRKRTTLAPFLPVPSRYR